MEKSADYIGIAVMILMVKVGLGIGPNLGILTSAGWALLLQELGHFFGTIVFGLPVALLVGMRREAVGACYLVDREPNVRSSSTNLALASRGPGCYGHVHLWRSYRCYVVLRIGWYVSTIWMVPSIGISYGCWRR